MIGMPASSTSADDQSPGARSGRRPFELTPENGFEVVAVDLATEIEDEKQEAWRQWETRPYRDEAQGCLIEDTTLEPLNSTVHQYLMGWEYSRVADVVGI